MIAGLRPYPTYKDSGVPWLGGVPRHWEVQRAKHLFREVDERSRAGTEELLSVSHKTGVTPRSQKNVTMFMAQSYAGHKLCRPADLVINTMWAWMGALGIARVPGIVSPSYAVYRPRAENLISPAFADTLLRTAPYVSEYVSRSTGVQDSRLRLYPEQFLRVPLVRPPMDEQDAIVRFLDYADRRIRRYIRAKQKLIKLLEEQRQAIIHRAVTRGLDPNVRLKPSGIEWLGDVPEHWAVVRNKTVCKLGTGHTPSRRVAEYWKDCTVPWFTLSDVHQIRADRTTHVDSTHERISELGVANSSAVVLPVGTVILSRTASVGFCAVLGREMATSQDFMAWIPGEKVVSEFLLWVLRAMRPEFRRLMHGSTHNTIYMPTLHAFQMPLPPISEQQSIVAHLSASVASIHCAADLAVQQVERLRECRTRLTADVVTGKLDVREAAAKLPDEREEPEPADEAASLAEGEEEIDDGDVDATDGALAEAEA